MENDPAPAGAQRAPHRQLATAGGAASQHQVGDVGAGDEQDARDRAEQNNQAQAHVADHLFDERSRAQPPLHARLVVPVGKPRLEAVAHTLQVRLGLGPRDAGFDRGECDEILIAAPVFDVLPVDGNPDVSINVLPPGAEPGDELSVAGTGVSATYFRTLNIALLRGRQFTPEEAFARPSSHPTPIILSETLARRVFGSIDVIGRTVRFTKTQSNPERDLPVILRAD